MTEWRLRLETALEKNKGAATRFLQLATVNENGRPAVRTVVFRGWQENSNRLTFAIDARSQKISQLQQQPWVELCWYFEQTREQFRLAGPTQQLTAQTTDPAQQQQRQRAWQCLSEAARAQFLWPLPNAPTPAVSQPPSPNQPLANFTLLLVQPQQVNYLRLHGEPHEHRHFLQQENGRWSETAVNP